MQHKYLVLQHYLGPSNGRVNAVQKTFTKTFKLWHHTYCFGLTASKYEG